MIYTIANDQTFIPEADGNRDLSAKEQGRIILNFPSVKEVGESYDNDEPAGLFTLKLYVKKFVNYQINDNGIIRDLTHNDVFTKSGFVNLYNEIKSEIAKLTDVDKKK